jgi:hypothetical protein
MIPSFHDTEREAVGSMFRFTNGIVRVVVSSFKEVSASVKMHDMRIQVEIQEAALGMSHMS